MLAASRRTSSACHRVRRNRLIGCAAAAALAVLHRPAGAIDTTWDPFGVGNWNDAGLWSAGVPNNGGGNTFNAFINSGTATLNINATIQDLSLTGTANLTSTLARTITLNDDLFVNGSAKVLGLVNLNVSGQTTWGSGNIGGSGVVNASGGFTFEGTLARSITGTRVINASSTSTWEGGAINADVGAVFNNSVQLTSETNASWNGGTFNNFGNYFKQTNPGQQTFTGVFNNHGFAIALAGRLSLRGGGTHTGNIGTVGTGTLEFRGPHDFQAGSQVGGSVVEFSLGEQSIGGSFSVQTLDITGSTVSFNATNSTATTLNLSLGSISGTGSLRVTGLTTWEGGGFSDSVTFNAVGNIDMSLSTNRSMVASATVNNGATATFGGTINLSGQSNATFVNLATGTFNQTGDAGFSLVSFDNNNLFNKTGGTGTATYSGIFNNAGTVNANAGTLHLAAGGTHSGNFQGTGTLVLSGLHNFLPGSTLDPDAPGAVVFGSSAGTTSVNLGAAVLGSGCLFTVTNNATVNYNGSGGFGTLSIHSGTLGGTATVSIASALNWIGGTISGSEAVFVNSGAPVTISSTATKTLSGRHLQVNGPTTWSDGNINMTALGAITNLAAGVFTINTDADITGTGLLTNQGVLTKAGGTGVTSIAGLFVNNGTVNVNAGTLTIASNGTHNGRFNTSAGGTLRFESGTNVLSASSNFTGTNIVFALGSRTVVNGTFSASIMTVTSAATVDLNSPPNAVIGALTLAGGTIGGSAGIVVSAASTWTSGAFSGTGTASINGGITISGGDSKAVIGPRGINLGSTASWTGGNFNNSANGAFNINALGILNIQSDADFNSGTMGVSGLLLKSGGGGVSEISAAVTVGAGGTVRVNVGTLSLENGANISGTLDGGLGTTLRLAGGMHLFLGAATVTHPNLVVSGGTMTVNTTSNLSLPNLSFSSARLTGPRDLNVTGLLNLGGAGEATLSSTLNAQGNANFQGGGTIRVQSILSLSGAGTWLDQTVFENTPAARFNILPGATFSVGGASTFTGGIINNQGTLSRGGGIIASSTFNAVYNSTGSTISNIGRLRFLNGGTHSGHFNGNGTGEIEFAGNHTFNAASSFGQPAVAIFSGGASVTSGAYDAQSTQVTGGTLTINGPQNHNFNAQFGVSSGAQLVLGSDAGAAFDPSITMANGGALTLNATQHLNNLTHNGINSVTTLSSSGSPGGKVLAVKAFNGGGTLDLTNNAMIVDYDGVSSVLGTVRNTIIAGRNGGNWLGAGITSATAAGDPGRLAVGYAEASEVLSYTGGTANFLGETVDLSSVLVRTTLIGDLNLDGQIGFVDLLTVAANFGAPGVTNPWHKGDINYDGQVGFVDLLAVAAGFGDALPASIPGATVEFNEALAAVAAGQVPEPCGLAMLGLGALATLRQRRQRRSFFG